MVFTRSSSHSGRDDRKSRRRAGLDLVSIARRPRTRPPPRLATPERPSRRPRAVAPRPARDGLLPALTAPPPFDLLPDVRLQGAGLHREPERLAAGRAIEPRGRAALAFALAGDDPAGRRPRAAPRAIAPQVDEAAGQVL